MNVHERNNNNSIAPQTLSPLLRYPFPYQLGHLHPSHPSHLIMSIATSTTRVALRQTCQLSRRSALRYNSTASKATEAAKETASKASEKSSEFTSKASEGLSRVTATAVPALSRAGSGILKTLGKVGGRTGKVVAFVERKLYPDRELPQLWKISLGG